MTYFKNIESNLNVGAQLDAANRLRTSQVFSLSDYKQINDNLPQFYDEVLNGSATATFVKASGGVEMLVAADGDYAIRETFQRHNYQAGKSELIELTMSDFGAQAGVTKRYGYYSTSTVAPYTADMDGVSIYNDGTSVYFQAHKGGVERLSVAQSAWNIDKFDGTGDSGVTIDWDNFNVFVFDFLYLGGTQIRFGFLIDGTIQWAHKFSHANNFDSPVILTPNQPVRMEIRSTGGTGQVNHICATVSSEGLESEVGILTSLNNGVTQVDADAVGTEYAVLGIRLKDAYDDVVVIPKTIQALATTNDNFIVQLKLNPTVAGTFTYNDVAHSSLQLATGATANTVTGGFLLKSVYGTANAAITAGLENARHIGRFIDGTKETLVLTVIPLSVNLDVYGVMNVRELI